MGAEGEEEEGGGAAGVEWRFESFFLVDGREGVVCLVGEGEERNAERVFGWRRAGAGSEEAVAGRRVVFGVRVSLLGTGVEEAERVILFAGGEMRSAGEGAARFRGEGEGDW